MLEKYCTIALGLLAGCGNTDTPISAPAPADAAVDAARDAPGPDADAGAAPTDANPADSGSDSGETDSGLDAGPDADRDGACPSTTPPPDYAPASEAAPTCDGLTPATLIGAIAAAGAHPLYPALRGDTLPLFGTPRFTYEVPHLPVTTRQVAVSDASVLAEECLRGQVVVHVDTSLPQTIFDGVNDCDIVLGPKGSIAGLLMVDSRRVRIRGGKVAGFTLQKATDVVIDGVIVDTGAAAPAERLPFLFEGNHVDRVAIVNVVGRAARTEAGTGSGFMASLWQNVLVAKSNFVTDPDTTSGGWFARLESGANWLFVDVQAKVFRDRLMHLGTDAFGTQWPLSYVVVRGGDYMHGRGRETFVNAGRAGESCVDHVYLDGVSFFLDAEPESAVGLGFGESSPNQLTFHWYGTDLHWFTRACAATNARTLASREAVAGPNELLRYRLGNPTYSEQPAGVRYPEWQAIPGSADPNPEHLPEL